MKLKIIDRLPRRPPPLHVSHGNIVIRFNVGVQLNMQQLVHDAPNMFGYVLMAGICRLKTPHMNILIFSNGTCQLMSATTEDHARFAIWAFILLLRRLGYKQATPKDLHINNIMSRMSLGGKISVEELHQAFPQRITKLHGKFTGCRIKMPKCANVKVTVFCTGNVNLIGAISHEQSMQIMQEVADMVRPFTT